MARTEAKLPGGARLADYLTVGYLALNCPLGQVKEALAACGVPTLIRRDMPREVLVYFVMAMCLYPRVAYEEVLRLVIEGLRRIYGDEVSEAQVSKAAISQGRSRLGWEVMRELFERQGPTRRRLVIRKVDAVKRPIRRSALWRWPSAPRMRCVRFRWAGCPTASRRSRVSCSRGSRPTCWCWPIVCSMATRCGVTRWPPERSCCGE